jgi:hypothetical protein
MKVINVLPLQMMEQMSILFDCVRRAGPAEAALLAEILPQVRFPHPSRFLVDWEGSFGIAPSRSPRDWCFEKSSNFNYHFSLS